MTTNYGRDISCADRLVTGRYSTGRRLLGEAIYRRITTPRGLLFGTDEEADYGIDITGQIGAAVTQGGRAKLAGKLRLEISKDPRIESVDVEIIETIVGPAISYAVTISCLSALGPFELVVAVTAVSAALIGFKET